jgi:hypothetical protein
MIVPGRLFSYGPERPRTPQYANRQGTCGDG